MFQRRAGKFIFDEAEDHFAVLDVGQRENFTASRAEPIVNDVVSIVSGTGDFQLFRLTQVEAKEFPSDMMIEANPASRICAFGNHFAFTCPNTVNPWI